MSATSKFNVFMSYIDPLIIQLLLGTIVLLCWFRILSADFPLLLFMLAPYSITNSVNSNHINYFQHKDEFLVRENNVNISSKYHN